MSSRYWAFVNRSSRNPAWSKSKPGPRKFSLLCLRWNPDWRCRTFPPLSVLATALPRRGVLSALPTGQWTSTGLGPSSWSEGHWYSDLSIKSGRRRTPVPLPGSTVVSGYMLSLRSEKVGTFYSFPASGPVTPFTPFDVGPCRWVVTHSWGTGPLLTGSSSSVEVVEVPCSLPGVSL